LENGNGTEESIGEDFVYLPEEIVTGYTNFETSISNLINDVLHSLDLNGILPSYRSVSLLFMLKWITSETNVMLIN
jgi:ATP-dependent DNA helicase PIF1